MGELDQNFGIEERSKNQMSKFSFENIRDNFGAELEPMGKSRQEFFDDFANSLNFDENKLLSEVQNSLTTDIQSEAFNKVFGSQDQEIEQEGVLAILPPLESGFVAEG